MPAAIGHFQAIAGQEVEALSLYNIEAGQERRHARSPGSNAILVSLANFREYAARIDAALDLQARSAA